MDANISNYIGYFITIVSSSGFSSFSNFLVAIGTFLLAFLTYKSTMEIKSQSKLNRLREKAISISSSEIPMLNQKIVELWKFINDNKYILYKDIHFEYKIKLSSDDFVNAVRNFKIFGVVNDKIILTYTEDETINKYMDPILLRINNYRKNVVEINETIETVLKLDPTSSFSHKVKELCDYGTWLELNRNDSTELKLLYHIMLLGSKEFEIKIIGENYSSIIALRINKNSGNFGSKFDYSQLESALLSDPESKRIYDDIQAKHEEIKSNLSQAQNEIQELDRSLQNKYIF